MGRAWGADLLRAGAIEQLPEERNDADQTEHEEDDAKPDAVKRRNYWQTGRIGNSRRRIGNFADAAVGLWRASWR